MAQSDGEIEYLEEDAEIVQHCVQLAQHDTISTVPNTVAKIPPSSSASLLVERTRGRKRKKIKDDDSEYDPSEDDLPPSPPSPPVRKKRGIRPMKSKAKTNESYTISSASNISQSQLEKPQSKENKTLTAEEQYLNRKKYNIRIPDYDDPLCLPVRALKTEDSDNKRLNNWNSVCLEHFKHCDAVLKPERGHTKSSIRTAVFKNVVNKQSGYSETTIWSKTSVVNEDGDKKSEIFQCVLPRYKEKKQLSKYILTQTKHYAKEPSVNEAILSKETHKDGDALVVYKPNESLSAVYGMIDKRIKPEDQEDDVPASNNEDKLYLQELTSCKLCTPCFQASWRGVGKYKQKSLECPVCGRPVGTMYNLLSHFKSHSRLQLQKYKRIISQLMADIVGYHYKCRVCQKQLSTIKALRAHVLEHQSKETFKCEVCDRIVNEQ